MSEQKQQAEAADGQSRLTAWLGMEDEFLIIGMQRILPSDCGLLAQLRQRGYDPVFQEFPVSQLPAPEQGFGSVGQRETGE